MKGTDNTMNYLYLDIETAGDDVLPVALVESLKASIKPDARRKDAQASIDEKYLEMIVEAPLNNLLNRVIAIGYAITSDSEDLKPLVTFKDVIVEEHEKVLLTHLHTVCSIHSPIKIFTFNGYNFDLPILRIAFMRHGINFPFRMTSKYDTNYHIDCRQILTNYDQYGKGTQEQWCMRLGIPVEPSGITGADIPSLWKDRNFEAIKGKCLDDLDMLVALSRKVRTII